MGWWSISGLPPSIKFASTHLYTWVERGTVRVKCLAQEHNTVFPARAQTQTARFGVERTNHEATSPPIKNIELSNNEHWSEIQLKAGKLSFLINNQKSLTLAQFYNLCWSRLDVAYTSLHVLHARIKPSNT